MNGTDGIIVKGMAERISSTFPDSILINQDFQIVQIGKNTLQSLGYTCREIINKPFSMLANMDNFLKAFNLMECSDHFEGEQIEIKRKNKGSSTFDVSGFRLRESESNYLIVLNFKSIVKADQALNTHLSMTEELDQFIYHSAHILRGPLATIKGLAHLALSPNPGEMSFIVKEIDKHADKLDSVLHRLVYFAESDKEYLANPSDLSLEAIVQKIELNLKESQLDFPVNFFCLSEEKSRIFENGQLLYSILNHLVLFLGNKPKEKNNKLIIDTQSSASTTEIMIRSTGFKLENPLIEKIQHVNYGHSEILKYPELVNYYAAKKIILKSGGKVQFMRIDTTEVVILLLLPAQN